MNYPSPCDKCEKVCAGAKVCKDYHAWVNAWWKHFNAVYRRLCSYRRENPEKFRYDHPDVYRRYIQRGPCPDCRAQEKCTMPCGTYWRWWDARMAWFRRRFT